MRMEGREAGSSGSGSGCIFFVIPIDQNSLWTLTDPHWARQSTACFPFLLSPTHLFLLLALKSYG